MALQQKCHHPGAIAMDVEMYHFFAEFPLRLLNRQALPLPDSRGPWI
jgi:hypothetical protein